MRQAKKITRAFKCSQRLSWACCAALLVLPFCTLLAQTSVTAGANVSEGSFSGFVQSETGEPIPQAHVRAVDPPILVLTNADGFFVFSALRDSLVVEISATGFALKRMQLRAGTAPNVMELELAIHELEAAEVSSQMGATGRPTQKSPDQLQVTDLDQIPAASRIAALASLPGVDMVTAGQGSMRPMIRGLSGLRIATLFNGARIESQAWGEYHGIYIPEEGVRSVEVIRGPASLAYGSDAYGGVLNFVPVAPLAEKGRESRLSLNLFSVTGGWQVTGATEKRSKSAFHAFRGGFKEHGDYSLPSGQAVSNSSYRQFFAQGSFGYLRSWGIVEGAYSSSYSNAGIIGHNGWSQSGDHLVTTSVRTSWGEWTLIPRVSYQLNHRKEFEHHHDPNPVAAEDPEELALDISLRSLRWDVSAERNWTNGWSVSAGLQGFKMSSGFDEEEGVELIHEALIPNSGADENSAYAVWGKKAEWWGVQFASRIDVRSTHSSEFVAAWEGTSRTDALNGFSAGGHLQLTDRLTWNAHAAQSQRIPGLSELLSSGVHHCAYRFEEGDVKLEKETSMNLESNIQWEGAWFKLDASIYRNFIDDYVLIVPTEMQQEGWSLHRWQATDALFVGGELAAALEGSKHEHLTAQLAVAVVNATDAEGAALPLIPPMTYRGTLGWRNGKVQSGMWLKNFRANAVLEHSSDATLIHGVLGATLANQLELNLSVHNVLNVEYIPTLSMLRNLGIAEPGRNVRIQLAWTF